MRQCKKQTTYAVIYKDGQVVGTGTNEIYADIAKCPREMQGCVPGEGYHLCTEVCKQKGHAEVVACESAGKLADGGTLYLMGHSYCCDNCLETMMTAGITEVVIAGTGERFNPMMTIIAKRYSKMGFSEFLEALMLSGPKSVEP
jgi:deoxycytidylate deaminase